MPEFSEQVLKLTKNIPKGKVATYADVAKALGKPKAARAVGIALRKNRTPLIIPCHRVIRSDGSVGGYSGKKNKAELLEAEGIVVENGKIELPKFRVIFKRLHANIN